MATTIPPRKKKKAKRPRVTQKREKPTVQDGDFSQASDGVLGNRVHVSVARTLNLGNYESLRVEYAEGHTLADGESFEEARQAVAAQVTEGLMEMLSVIKEAMPGEKG